MELLKIETQRLLLRQFAIGDAEDVFAILSDEQTTLDCGGYHAFEEMDEEYERLMQKFAAQTRYSIVCRAVSYTHLDVYKRQCLYGNHHQPR